MTYEVGKYLWIYVTFLKARKAVLHSQNYQSHSNRIFGSTGIFSKVRNFDLDNSKQETIIDQESVMVESPKRSNNRQLVCFVQLNPNILKFFKAFNQNLIRWKLFIDEISQIILISYPK